MLSLKQGKELKEREDVIEQVVRKIGPVEPSS
jgi:hypothetical protein